MAEQPLGQRSGGPRAAPISDWLAEHYGRYWARPLSARYFFARLTVSQPLTTSFLSTVALSFLPEPQSTVSVLPFRAFSVSLPAPPLNLLTPLLSVSLSLPLPPFNVSFPAPPLRLSLF